MTSELQNFQRKKAQKSAGKKNGAPTSSTPGAAAVAPRRPLALLPERTLSREELVLQEGLIAWSAPGHNRHVVVCYIPGTDPYNPLNLVTWRVRDNTNFMRGMKIPDGKPPGNKVRITPVSDRDSVFDLQGPIPRWKGRW